MPSTMTGSISRHHGRCAVASAGAAALGVGLCVLAAPEFVVGAVVVTGVVVVGFVIEEAWMRMNCRGGPEEAYLNEARA